MITRAPLKIGLDVDGVLAQFNPSAARTIVHVTGRDLIPDPPVFNVWNWIRAFGYLPTEEHAFWSHVTESPRFWLDLDHYPGTPRLLHYLDVLVRAHQATVTFLTTRPSHNAHWQTSEWLYDRGMSRPQVCICRNSESKGIMAAGLELDVFVDDHGPNIAAVKKHAPATALALYEQPWNGEDAIRAESLDVLGIHRIATLDRLELWLKEFVG